jgi:hypothetical protein
MEGVAPVCLIQTLPCETNGFSSLKLGSWTILSGSLTTILPSETLMLLSPW